MKVNLVLTERQAKALVVYLRMLRDHGAGRDCARDFRAVNRKLEAAMKRACISDIGGEAAPHNGKAR